MSISEIVQLEDKNHDCIILHAEGIFWRAYERSAYAFANQIAQMQILKKPFKVLKGREICYLGFPMTAAENHLKGLILIEESEKLRKYKASEQWTDGEFQEWHDAQPLTEKTVTADAKEDEKLPYMGVIETIKNFDISTSTPLDAFSLLVKLKQMLK